MTRGAEQQEHPVILSIVGKEPHHTTGRKQHKKEKKYTRELERSLL